eukprot:gnl/Dysnectes_brevis/629_a696_1289.p1 GENE.gnl/Dysnectes_brevis/629_a696_1289~~gnl/Dysnectes_brevis/629_a696_1289.p1  ORF type:complete len:1109 (-),score=276.33 gnl/Dysnectes_brevis/629_a696_1289:1182-4508(-)
MDILRLVNSALGATSTHQERLDAQTQLKRLEVSDNNMYIQTLCVILNTDAPSLNAVQAQWISTLLRRAIEDADLTTKTSEFLESCIESLLHAMWSHGNRISQHQEHQGHIRFILLTLKMLAESLTLLSGLHTSMSGKAHPRILEAALQWLGHDTLCTPGLVVITQHACGSTEPLTGEFVVSHADSIVSAIIRNLKHEDEQHVKTAARSAEDIISIYGNHDNMELEKSLKLLTSALVESIATRPVTAVFESLVGIVSMQPVLITPIFVGRCLETCTVALEGGLRDVNGSVGAAGELLALLSRDFPYIVGSPEGLILVQKCLLALVQSLAESAPVPNWESASITGTFRDNHATELAEDLIDDVCRHLGPPAARPLLSALVSAAPSARRAPWGVRYALVTSLGLGAEGAAAGISDSEKRDLFGLVCSFAADSEPRVRWAVTGAADQLLEDLKCSGGGGGGGTSSSASCAGLVLRTMHKLMADSSPPVASGAADTVRRLLSSGVDQHSGAVIESTVLSTVQTLLSPNRTVLERRAGVRLVAAFEKHRITPPPLPHIRAILALLTRGVAEAAHMPASWLRDGFVVSLLDCLGAVAAKCSLPGPPRDAAGSHSAPSNLPAGLDVELDGVLTAVLNLLDSDVDEDMADQLLDGLGLIIKVLGGTRVAKHAPGLLTLLFKNMPAEDDDQELIVLPSDMQTAAEKASFSTLSVLLSVAPASCVDLLDAIISRSLSRCSLIYPTVRTHAIRCLSHTPSLLAEAGRASEWPRLREVVLPALVSALEEEVELDTMPVVVRSVTDFVSCASESLGEVHVDVSTLLGDVVDALAGLWTCAKAAFAEEVEMEDDGDNVDRTSLDNAHSRLLSVLQAVRTNLCRMAALPRGPEAMLAASTSTIIDDWCAQRISAYMCATFDVLGALAAGATDHTRPLLLRIYGMSAGTFLQEAFAQRDGPAVGTAITFFRHVLRDNPPQEIVDTLTSLSTAVITNYQEYVAALGSSCALMLHFSSLYQSPPAELIITALQHVQASDAAAPACLALLLELTQQDAWKQAACPAVLALALTTVAPTSRVVRTARRYINSYVSGSLQPLLEDVVSNSRPEVQQRIGAFMTQSIETEE